MATLSASTTTLAISLAILHAPQAFHDVCYRMQEKQELLAGISEFLDEVRSRLFSETAIQVSCVMGMV